MSVTENQANGMWCPMIKDKAWCGGSKCMAWRRSGAVRVGDSSPAVHEDVGYCGLAGEDRS